MVDRVRESAELGPGEPDGPRRYDRRNLTYANTFENPFKSALIRAIEWATGKITILRLVREFERTWPEPPRDQRFWRAVLDTMGIPLLTPEDQLRNIPREGPVVVVANHPHGMVDGMVLADLVGHRRTDYKILSRSVLDGLDEFASSYMILVPFPHDEGAQQKGIEMRAAAMRQLQDGGVVIVFPSGVVASSQTLFGPAVEAEWNVFTAQLIRRSGAKVVPIFYPGANSRWYQIANRVSATLRQGLLLHEIVQTCNKPRAPVVGEALDDEQMQKLQSDPRGFMTWLREHTLSLGEPGAGD